MPSFRRSLRARCFFDNHVGFDKNSHVVVLVVRSYDFGAYVKEAGKACVVVRLPEMSVGVGVQICHLWKLDFAVMLDDDVKSLKKHASIIDVVAELQKTMATDGKIALVGGTKTVGGNTKNPDVPWDQTPQVLVLLNLKVLQEIGLNYDHRLCFCEDFVLAMMAVQRGTLVKMIPAVKVNGEMTHAHGGVGSPASGK
jgi:hypothetical protein